MPADGRWDLTGRFKGLKAEKEDLHIAEAGLLCSLAVQRFRTASASLQ